MFPQFPQDQTEAAALYATAQEYEAKRDYTAAILHFKIVAAYYKKQGIHDLYVRSLIHLSFNYHDSLQEALNRQVLRKAIGYARHYLGEASTLLGALYLNVATYYQKQHQFRLLCKYAKQAVKIYELPSNFPLKGDAILAYQSVGNAAVNLGDYATAAIYYEKALLVPQLSTYNRLVVYYELGNLNFKQGLFEKASRYYQKVDELISQHFYSADHVATMLNGYAVFLNQKGDYVTALSYSKRALQALKDFLQVAMHPNYAPIFNTMGSSYLHLGDLDKALSCFKQLRQVAQKPIYIMYVWGNLASIFHHKKQYAKAIYYAKRAISWAVLHRSEISTYKNMLANVYQTIASCYFFWGKYEWAIGGHQKLLAYHLSVHEHNVKAAQSCINIANCYEKLQNYDQVIAYCQQALQILQCGNTESSLIAPTLPPSVDNSYLLEALSAKARFLLTLYQKDQQIAHLQSALAHYLRTDELIDRMRQSFRSEGSKLHLAGQVKTVYEKGIETALLLHANS
ncbi:MAG: tetratricopeptide repeat protein [Chitinophagales bacterium]|nr:tetratricopeptide repeat protein [Chitinophagales bacterium]